MKLKQDFIRLLAKSKELLLLICVQLEMPKKTLINRIRRGQAFDYEESKAIINVVGAETMMPLIDWEGTNARNSVC